MKLFGEELRMGDESLTSSIMYSCFWNDYEIEKIVKRDDSGNKVIDLYGAHQERVIKEGYERSLGVSEIIHLLDSYYNNILPKGLVDVVDDMMSGHAEFLSTVIRKDGGYVSIYEGVFRLEYDDEEYEEPIVPWYRSSSNMSLADVKSGAFLFEEIIDKNPEIYMFLMGYENRELSKQTKQTLLVELPEDGIICPYSFRHEHGLNKLYLAREDAASRGVREK